MQKIAIRIRDKHQIHVRLWTKKPIKIKVAKLAIAQPVIPPLSDLILNYKIGRL